MRRTLALLVLGLLAAPGMAARPERDQMLAVVTPVARATVPAHPHVNVIVRFGPSPDGYVPDPDTFRARIGRADVTPRFRPILENGTVVGMRAELLPPQIRPGRRVRLRVEVKSHPRKGAGPRTARDGDRIRFRPQLAENRPPVASLVSPSEVVFPDVELQFDATASQDPDLDELAYAWDFGDGQTATAGRATHVFPGSSGPFVVGLTVSDGAASASAQTTLVTCPGVDEGRTPGMLRVEASRPMEFNAVAPGSRGSLGFTVLNTDETPASQLRVQLRVDGDGFQVSPPSLDLGPGQAAPVTVTFQPTASGHRAGDVVMVASAANRCALHLLAHGYGGTAGGTGPTGALSPLFYTNFGSGLSGILPDGSRFAVDSNTGVCQLPGLGLNGDLCIDDDDCAANGGTCNPSVAGTFFTVDACSDGRGALYLMSDEGTYTDPTPSENDLSVTLLRLSIDANGNRTGAKILSRETTGTRQLACDQLMPGNGGQVYLAEFREVTTPPECLRGEQEALLSLSKSNGAKSPPLLSRIDAAEGLDACDDDIDQVVDLNVTPDGLTVFASLESGGLFQLRPGFRAITPDLRDVFQLHPDGDIVTVQMRNSGTTGLINVFRISPQQAATGAIHLRDLQPCATFKVPNNGGPESPGQIGHVGEHFFAVGSASAGSFDGVLLAGFYTTGAVGETPPALASNLRVQGVVAFALPAGSASCSTVGLVGTDMIDTLTF